MIFWKKSLFVTWKDIFLCDRRVWLIELEAAIELVQTPLGSILQEQLRAGHLLNFQLPSTLDN